MSKLKTIGCVIFGIGLLMIVSAAGYAFTVDEDQYNSKVALWLILGGIAVIVLARVPLLTRRN